MNGQTLAVRRVFDVPWADRWIFIMGTLGYSKVVDGSTTQVTRIIPMSYELQGLPAADGNPFIYATVVERIEGIGLRGNNDGVGKYVTARISVGFEGVEYLVLSDQAFAATNIPPSLDEGEQFVRNTPRPRFVSKKYVPNAEFLTLPHGQFKWVLANAQGNEIPGNIVVGSHGRIIPGAEMVMVWHRAPRAPIPAIENCLGGINNVGFAGYPEKRLRLVAAEVTPYRWLLGSRLYDVKYHFRAFIPPQNVDNVANANWNYFIYFAAGERPVYRQLTHNGRSIANPQNPGTPVFPEVNFQTLFQPGVGHDRI